MVLDKRKGIKILNCVFTTFNTKGYLRHRTVQCSPTVTDMKFILSNQTLREKGGKVT